MRASADERPGQTAVRRALKSGRAARAASASSPRRYSSIERLPSTSAALGQITPPAPQRFTNSASFTSVGTSNLASAVHGVTSNGNGPRSGRSAATPPATANATIPQVRNRIVFSKFISFSPFSRRYYTTNSWFVGRGSWFAVRGSSAQSFTMNVVPTPGRDVQVTLPP